MPETSALTQIKKPHVTAHYERWRIRSPKAFKAGSFRTHDIGRKGYSKRVAGKLSRTGKWATQSLLISHMEPAPMKARLRREAAAAIHRSKPLRPKRGLDRLSMFTSGKGSGLEKLDMFE